MTKFLSDLLVKGAITLTSFVGSGTRMIVTDSNGVLNTQAIPESITLTDNGDSRIITGTATANTLRGSSKLNWYNDIGILALKATASWGYGAEIDFDNTEVNGTQWGFYGGSTSDTGFMLYRYLPGQVELAYWNTDRYAVRNDVKIGWSATNLSFNAMDVALARESAGVVQINNGTTNIYADLKLAGLTATSLAGTGTRMVVADTNGNLGVQSVPTGSLQGAVDADKNTSGSLAVGTTIVKSVSATTYSGVFFDYVVKNGTNVRVGSVVAITNGTNVESYETLSNDIGTTTDITFTVTLGSGNINLNAVAAGTGFTVIVSTRAI